jgi:thiamine-monophosphate kinase
MKITWYASNILVCPDMNEFDLIHVYFQSRFAELTSSSSGIRLGIGDDCAIFAGSLEETVVSTDTLISGRHFPENCPGDVVAARSLGAAASDLASMGVKPLGFTLALSMPEYNAEWLSKFSETLLCCAEKWQLPLVGGDTVCGSLVVTITVFGRVASGQALLRQGACAGDDIWVSGTLGDAAGGLALTSGQIVSGTIGDQAYLRRRYEAPQPRLSLGQRLRGLATAAIDVSDGLLADLGHILKASVTGARVQIEHLPVSKELRAVVGWDAALLAALTGGDDYELCFTAAPGLRGVISAAADKECILTRIGNITAEPALKVFQGEVERNLSRHGFKHF